MNLFNLQFHKNKRQALKNIYKQLNNERCTVSWRKANQHIKTVKKASSVVDIKEYIAEEIKQILRKANRTVAFFNDQTNWFEFGDIQVAVDHSYLDNTDKDLIEQELIVLQTIAKALDLSR